MAVYTKKWNSTTSTWVTAPIKKYNSGSWVDAYTYKWNASSSKWIQIYPETAVSSNFGWQSNQNYRSWRESGYETTTSTTTFKQGPYGSYTAAYGYSDMTSSSIPGTKNVASINFIDIIATRGGAGSYNADKTIYFWRSADKPSSVPTLLGNYWTATAYGVGKDTNFDSDMDITSHTLNWVNQVSSGKYLWIYTSNANHYLSLGPTFKLEIDYTYTATTAAFVDDTTPAMVVTAADDYNSIKNTSYHTMTIYDDEIDMSLQEIMQRREDGVVEDIKPSCVDRAYVAKPWSREYHVSENRNGDKVVWVEIFGLRENDEVQMSVDGVNWTQMKQFEAKYCYLEGILPPDFNKMYDWVYVRCVNLKTDELYFVLDIEPTIIIA